MNQVLQQDKTALSYWFPKIEAAGLPVPKTSIIHMDADAIKNMWGAIDGKQAGDCRLFFGKIIEATKNLGLPCFLRTDHTSNKHQWDKTCYLKSIADIPRHVFEIVEFSMCCDLVGLPWDTWAVRELLPTIPLGTCPRYGNMPVCREFRFFVDDGKVRCSHPYWSEDSLNEGEVKWFGNGDLYQRADESLYDLASRAGTAVGGSWSIDILETKKGWYVTDMAEAHKSFHWEGCDKV